MNRKSFIKNSLLGVASLATMPTFLRSKSTISKVLPQAEARLSLLRGSVHLFAMSGGSMGAYLAEDHSVIIDSQYPANAEQALLAFKEQGLATSLLLCNTHHHGDHTGGNTIFAQAGMKILAHKAVPTYMQKQSEERNRPLPEVPKETFDSSIEKKLGKELLQARHFGAGHTAGDAVYHFEQANVAHLGDLVFNDVYPFIDANGGGSLKGWISVLQGIEAYFDDDTLFIFGHGKEVTGTLKDVSRKRSYLEKLVGEAEKAVANGIDKETIKNDTTLVFERTEMWNGARSMNLERAWEQASELKN